MSARPRGTPMKKYRVAVIGRTGRGGYGHGLDVVWKGIDNAEIVAVADRHLDLHRDMVVACARAGASVFLEKPMARTLEEADEMVRACEAHHVKLAIAHQTRYSPRVARLRELIASGRLGDLLEARARGKEDGRGGGEDLMVLGTHLFDLMRLLAGDPAWCFARLLQNGKPAMKADVHDGGENI